MTVTIKTFSQKLFKKILKKLFELIALSTHPAFYEWKSRLFCFAQFLKIRLIHYLNPK